jgi:polysaccharide export outer membrane protein
LTGAGAGVLGRRRLLLGAVNGGLGLTVAYARGACAPVLYAPDELPPYTLRPGDRIAVTVHQHPELSGEMDLDGGGLVRLPLAGTVSLAGLTVRTAETRIAARLEGVWVRGASVAVALLAHAPVFILGEVRRPGRFQYRPGMTVLEAVALAGGYTYRARLDWVTIRRPDSTGQLQKLYGFPDTPLLPGDGVDVPERIF